jgi:hypothetical protein
MLWMSDHCPGKSRPRGVGSTSNEAMHFHRFDCVLRVGQLDCQPTSRP